MALRLHNSVRMCNTCLSLEKLVPAVQVMRCCEENVFGKSQLNFKMIANKERKTQKSSMKRSKMVSVTIASPKRSLHHDSVRLSPSGEKSKIGKLFHVRMICSKMSQSKKELKEIQFQTTWGAIEEFCLNSGIDGLKYFADTNRRWFERFFVFVFRILKTRMFCFCFLILHFYLTILFSQFFCD